MVYMMLRLNGLKELFQTDISLSVLMVAIPTKPDYQSPTGVHSWTIIISYFY